MVLVDLVDRLVLASWLFDRVRISLEASSSRYYRFLLVCTVSDADHLRGTRLGLRYVPW